MGITNDSWWFFIRVYRTAYVCRMAFVFEYNCMVYFFLDFNNIEHTLKKMQANSVSM